MDKKISTTLHKKMNITNYTNPFPLDLSPQTYIYNRYTPQIHGITCTMLLRTNIKYIHKIIKLLSWHNQQRLALWDTQINNIDWDATTQYLSYNDRPKALYMDLVRSNLKNFKVKLLAEKLPTHLILHFHHPTKHSNHLCPRCYTESEDISYIITCTAINTTPALE